MDFIYEYQDATKKLSEEMEKDLIAEIPKKYTSLNDKRQTQIDDTKAIRTALNNKTKPKTSDNWQSSFKIPDLFEIKQTLKAHLWENLWSNPDNMFSVEGQDEASEKGENLQKASLVDSLHKMKFSQELDKSVDDLIDTGDFALFVGWETRTKQIRRKKTVQEKMQEALSSDIMQMFQPKEKFVVEDKIVYDGAKVKRIDPMALVFDDDKTIFITRAFESPESLKENKVYTIKDYDELKNIATDEKDSSENNKNNEITDDAQIAHNGRIEVLEAWGDIKLQDGTILKNWLVTIAGRKQIIRFEANPFIIEPIIYGNLIEDPDTQRGISILKPVLSMSELNSDILNKKIDALALKINPAYLAPKGCFKGEQVVKPGKIIEYDAALMPTPPVPIQFDYEAGWDFMQYIKALMETTTGVFKNMSGVEEGKGTTATEIKARVGGQTSRLSMIVDTLNQNLIIPMIEKVADLNANFKFGVEEVKGKVKGINQFLSINDDIRQGNYQYTYGDSNAVQAEQLRVKEFGDIVARFMENPEFAQTNDINKLFEVVTQKMGFEDMAEKIKRDYVNQGTIGIEARSGQAFNGGQPQTVPPIRELPQPEQSPAMPIN